MTYVVVSNFQTFLRIRKTFIHVNLYINLKNPNNFKYLCKLKKTTKHFQYFTMSRKHLYKYLVNNFCLYDNC